MHTSGEKVIELEAGWCYLRYAEAGRNNPSLLFIHGLGDSSLAFDEALADQSLRDFNLYAPDLFGCGRSTCAGDNDYRLEKLGRHLRELMKQLKVESYYLVGHSMGGDIATLMAQADDRNSIRAVVNIEGNLTQDDLFISRTAAQMSAAGRFYPWFESTFKTKTVLHQWGRLWPSCRRYFASLGFCRADVFAAYARELIETNGKTSPPRETAVGRIYAALPLPKIFCWGSGSLSQQSRVFLADQHLDHKEFGPAFHWPMIDLPHRFYEFMADFILQNEKKEGRSL